MLSRKSFFLILSLFLIFLFYLFINKINENRFPEELTEETCMELLERNRPNINNLTFNISHVDNYTYKKYYSSSIIDKNYEFTEQKYSETPNYIEIITFVYYDEDFESCNIFNLYTNNEVINHKNFGEIIICDKNIFSYTIKELNSYYMLKYSSKEVVNENETVITSQYMYSKEDHSEREFNKIIDGLKNLLCN